jgi:hypothetical protein
MRQRRALRIVLEGALRPGSMLAGAAAAVVLATVGVAVLANLTGSSGFGTPASPSPSPRAGFELVITGGPGDGSYVADPSAGLDVCATAPDGSTRFLYAGGDPFVDIDLLVGAGARTDGGSAEVAAEIGAGDGYLRFDPASLRGGDPLGRSEASVTVHEGDAATTFVVTLTVVCPG